MKKVLLIPFLLSFHFTYAGTGSGNDVIPFYLAIIAVMLFILVVISTINFISKIIKRRKEKKITDSTEISNNENIKSDSLT